MEKRAEDEKDVYDMTLNYIARGSYPQDATKQDKCAIRKRAKQYRVQDAREKVRNVQAWFFRVVFNIKPFWDWMSTFVVSRWSLSSRL